jgi:signal transduction histidine kinase
VHSRDEVGQLTESFNRMSSELKRRQEEALTAAKFAFAGELAAMVAHEVRTPLSVMRSSAQMLISSQPPDRGAELVDTIVSEVDRVERVVTGLIELARPMPQRLEPTSIREPVARAAELTAAEAKRRGIALTCEFSQADGAALCDPEQVYQVALNLIVNALQAVPSGGSIALRTLSGEDGYTGFEVRDDGPGLPATVRANLFQPFVSGREGGTGLGLAFVDRIVKAHHGTVSVSSGRDRGTVFRVRLPVARSVQ